MNFRKTFRADDQLFAQCDQEPIHIPGSIQPHGVLLGVEPKYGRITVTSENSATLFGIDAAALIGRKIDTLFGSASTYPNILASIHQWQPSLERRNRIPMRLTGELARFDAELHLTPDDRLIIELEQPVTVSPQPVDLLRYSKEIECIRSLSLQFSAENCLDTAYAEVARQIRALTGYDRVMVYKMDNVGHGEIIAEQRREDLESFLGMHFPATDIPSHARQLYIRNRIRHLAKIDYEPVPLFPLQHLDDPHTLDLSLCHLRSFSPVHREYLTNMGVAATLVISLVQEGKLWGLIACHHYSPLHLSSETRGRCEVLAHMLSVLIEAEESRRSLHALKDARITAKRLHGSIKDHVNWHARLLQQQSVLLGQMFSSGFAMVVEGEVHGIGLLPSETEVHRVIDQLSTNNENHLASSYNLSRDVPGFPENTNFCGCLKYTVSTTQEIHLLWFRPEHAQQLSWGGDPRKSLVVEDETNRLSPRKSFEKWTELVRFESLPWDIEQLTLAESIANVVSEQKIEDASRLKTQFLANMSHEIRTPLTAIVGYADLLREQIESDPSCDSNICSANTTMTIQRNAEHLLKIIGDILDVAKIEAGKVEILESVVDLHNLIQDIQAIALPKAKEKQIDLRMTSVSQIPKRLTTDGTRLKQILLNLIHNAIKFTECGYVEVELADDDSSGIPMILFRVRDTGIGISRTQSRRLFNSFVQAEESMNRKFGGIGLGLSIAKRFAKLLGGELLLEWSEVGKGSCFCLKLPANGSASKSIQLQQYASASAPLGTTSTFEAKEGTGSPSLTYASETEQNTSGLSHERPLHILLAEDSIDNQRLIMHLLRKQGWQVDLAENGEIAVNVAWKARCSGSPYDIILMDMQMPVMDGYQATRTLRQRGYNGPIIAVTAHAMTGDSAACTEAGCDAYTTKPIKREELFGMVERFAKTPQLAAIP